MYQDGLGGQSRPRVWKRLQVGCHHLSVDGDTQRRYLLQHDEGIPAVRERVGIGSKPPVHAPAHASRYCACVFSVVDLRVCMRCDVRIHTHLPPTPKKKRQGVHPRRLHFSCCVTFSRMAPCEQPITGAAQQGRGRRLRAAWRQVLPAVAVAVAAFSGTGSSFFCALVSDTVPGAGLIRNSGMCTQVRVH